MKVANDAIEKQQTSRVKGTRFLNMRAELEYTYKSFVDSFEFKRLELLAVYIHSTLHSSMPKHQHVCQTYQLFPFLSLRHIPYCYRRLEKQMLG